MKHLIVGWILQVKLIELLKLMEEVPANMVCVSRVGTAQYEHFKQ